MAQSPSFAAENYWLISSQSGWTVGVLGAGRRDPQGTLTTGAHILRAKEDAARVRSAALRGAAVPAGRPCPSCCSQGGSGVHPRGNTFTTNRFSSQVARKLQPSVVWIGDTEKTFYKKVPHAERKVSASRWILSGAFSLLPRGGPVPGTTSISQEGLAFSREEGNKGPASLCPERLSVSERIQCLIFTRHNLEDKMKERVEKGGGEP